jgi:CheY-like chemotaxis protein
VSSRAVPLIVIGSAHSALAEITAAQLRREGNVVYVTHSAEGCLRVATSVAPDVVLLDADFPRRIERLLKAHPMSAHAQVLHLSDDLSGLAPQRPQTARKVGPHAA